MLLHGVRIGCLLPATTGSMGMRRRLGVLLAGFGGSEAASLFVSPEGGLRAVLDEDAFAVLLNRARTEQVLSDMASDLKGVEGDHERRIVRTRAARQLAMWSPRRRRVQRMEVAGLDGEVVRDSAAAARLSASRSGCR